MPAQHWARNFQIDQDDIEFLAGTLLERETPLSTEALAQILIEHRLDQEAEALQERFKDARFYNPADTYEVGQRIIFPMLDYAAAVVTGLREGMNPEHHVFTVVQVEFDPDADLKPRDREFASQLQEPHALSREIGDDGNNDFLGSSLTADDILYEAGDDIIYTLEQSLAEAESLVQVANKWFPRELVTEVNVGHLHLAEAILDINAGSPMKTHDILKEIGSLEAGSPELQTFSLNLALRDDSRFDEVGPRGQVLWYLSRLEPAEVQQTPRSLRFSTFEYDHSLLSQDMLDLEQEIDDEWSDLEKPQNNQQAATATIIYPHRRAGTLPLNSAMRRIFPTDQRTERVFVTLIDGEDDEAYAGWVVKKGRYIYGLSQFYRKYQLPVGSYISAQTGPKPGQIVLNATAYRPRTEWVRIMVARDNRFAFEDSKRSIGADYDDLIILGADDLEAIDQLAETYRQQNRTLATIINHVLVALSPLSPQGTVHAKTIYSAVNVIRRCPPGAVFATLVANLDFQNVGGHYWKLSSR
jgi:hypothetical protein